LRDRAIIELLYASGLRIPSWPTRAWKICNGRRNFARSGKGNKTRIVLSWQGCEALRHIYRRNDEVGETPERQ